MTEELALISDGDGLAVIGDPELVERFLAEQELPSTGLNLARVSTNLAAGAGAAQVASEAWAQSGRWVKLTKQSAEKVKRFGLTDSGVKGVKHAMVGPRGSVKSWIQIDKRAAAQLTNPAFMTGAAGIMTQVAMQQAMNEVVGYLEAIDEKLDDVLRSQKDAALAPMIGTGFVLEEAMALRDARGRVDDITWSKLHGASAAVAETQAYALRQLDALAEKLERTPRLSDLAEATRELDEQVQEWLAVLARSFQLQDAIAVLELDRVLDAAPNEVDAHRLGLRQARHDRLRRISASTERILTRIDAAAHTANAKVLTHPAKAPAVVRTCGQASTAVARFHDTLGIERGHHVPTARRWTDAIRDTGDKALAAGAESVDVARRAGDGAAKSAKAAGERAKVVGERAKEAGGRAKDAGGKARARALRLRETVAPGIPRAGPRRASESSASGNSPANTGVTGVPRLG